MNLIVSLFKWLLILTGSLLGLIVVFMVAWSAYALWKYPDLPVATVQEKYYAGRDIRVADVDGVSLHYTIEGQPLGQAPVIALLHSHYWSMLMWDAWVEQLQDKFTIVRYDLTTHGLTGGDPKDDYTAYRGAELLAGLLDNIGVKKASVAGSSSGGSIAYNFAARYPDKIENLIIMNAPGIPRSKRGAMERGIPHWMAPLIYIAPPSFLKALLSSVVDKSLITEEVVEQHFNLYRREGNRPAEFIRLSYYDPKPINDTLAKITAPTLILWGEQNKQLEVAHAQKIKELLVSVAKVEVITYPNVGHVIPVENPQQSVQDVKKFLLSNLAPVTASPVDAAANPQAVPSAAPSASSGL
jgi:pimeloyl-ACP methyl ester carboxylesterase